MATPLLINGDGVNPLKINPEYLPYGGSLVSSVNGQTGAITITGSGIASVSVSAPSTIDVNVPAGAAQVLSQAGNIVSLSGGGGSVDISTTTLVSATATKTTQQTYVGGGFLETQFGGQVKSIANIVSQPPLGGGSVALQGGLSKVAIASADASITPPSVEFQDGATLGSASVAYNGVELGVNVPMNAGANLVKSSAVPSANDDLCNKLYVDSAIGGVVDSVNAGTNISVDNTDPANPIVSLPTSLTGAITFTTNLPQCSQVPSAGDDLVNKTYVDGKFPPTADTLSAVLLAGNNAGATSIDMNQQDINSVANIYMRDDTDDTPNIYFTKTGTTKARIEYNGNGTNDFVSMTGDSVVLDFAKGNLELNSSLFARIQTQDSLPIRLVRETSAPIVPETTMELSSGGQVVIGAVGSGITAPSLKLQGDAGGSALDFTLDNTNNWVNTTGLLRFPTTLPQSALVPSLGDEMVNKTYADGVLTKYYFTDFNSQDGGDFTFTNSGGATNAYFGGGGGVFDAGIASVARLRSGFFTQTTTGSGTNAYSQSSNATWSPRNIKSITWGVIPLGNGTLASLGVDAGNINQAMAMAVGTSTTDAQAVFIGWRLSSASATIPSWTLVENNVVLETLSGANLTGNLANKFCRVKLIFTNNGANFYGVWTNLTDGAQYTTATYATTNPDAFHLLYTHCGTTNATNKSIAFDYLLVENNCLPVGGTTSSATSR